MIPIATHQREISTSIASPVQNCASGPRDNFLVDIAEGFVHSAPSFEGFAAGLENMNLCCRIDTDSLLSLLGEELEASDTAWPVRSEQVRYSPQEPEQYMLAEAWEPNLEGCTVHGERKLVDAGQRTSFFGQPVRALGPVDKCQCVGVFRSQAADDTAVVRVGAMPDIQSDAGQHAAWESDRHRLDRQVVALGLQSQAAVLAGGGL